MESLLHDVLTLVVANCIIERLRQISNGAESTHSKWDSAESDGNTVLHTAAINCNPSRVAWILEKSENLRQRNHCGETPGDALKARLEDLRTTRGHDACTEHISDQFAGFDLAALLT